MMKNNTKNKITDNDLELLTTAKETAKKNVGKDPSRAVITGILKINGSGIL